MTGALAFYRLAWRPAMLVWGVWLVGAVGIWATATAGGSPLELLRALFGGMLDDAALRAFARASIVLPMLAGFVAGRVTKEVQHGLFAWTLPGLRQRFAAGVIPLALVTASPAALALARAGQPAVALALLCTGTLWFAMATAVFDPYPSAAVSRATLAALVAVLIAGDDAVVALIEARPLACAAVAAPAAALYFLRELSAGAARTRPFVPVFPLGASGERQWMLDRLTHRPPPKREWTVDYIGSGLGRWLRALEYEHFGKYALGWPGWTAGIALLGTIAAVLTRDDPGAMARAVALVVAVHHVLASPSPRRWVPYPLGRAQRARIAFWGSTLHSAGACALLAVLLLAAAALVPRLPLSSFAGPAFPPAATSFALAGSILAWTPLLQYVRLRWLIGKGAAAGPAAGVAILVVTVTAYALGAAESAERLAEAAGAGALPGGSAGVLGVVAAGALITHAAYRVLLGRYYAGGDLL